MLQIMYKIFDEMGIFLLYFNVETRRLVTVLWKFPAFWRGKNRVVCVRSGTAPVCNLLIIK